MSDKNPFEKLVVLIIAVWSLAVLMLLVNHIQYQVLEGIRRPISKLTGLKISQRQALSSLRSRRDTLRLRLTKDKSLPDLEYQELQGILRELASKFPRNSALLLPTRFANAIRAFEHYSNDVYGADSVALWAHLTSVVPKGFHDALNDARSQVDCLVNICFFSGIVALAAFARLVQKIWSLANGTLSESDRIFNWPFTFPIAIVAAAWILIVAYRLSLERIHSWGCLVKAAFDCYLPALAKQLGYELPKTADERRQFWIEVSQRAVYHRVLKPERWSQVSLMKSEAVTQEIPQRLTENELSDFSRLWHDGCGETIIEAQNVDRNHSPEV